MELMLRQNDNQQYRDNYHYAICDYVRDSANDYDYLCRTAMGPLWT